jgi:GNAT superfamily N-acetyltransferase
MNDWVRRYARQNQERDSVVVMVVAPATDPHEIAGLYGLSAASLSLDDTPRLIAKRLPRHPVPCVLLARLAVSQNHLQQGLGQQLLQHAAIKCIELADAVGIAALLIHAKNEALVTWYQRNLPGLEMSPSDPRHLIISTATIRASIKP